MVFIGAFAMVLVIIVGATILFGIAVWFGMFFIAPRIARVLRRSEIDEEPGDRPD